MELLNDNSFDPTDGYDVRPGDGPQSFTRQLFGRDIAFFRFLVVDVDHTMFNSTALPLTPVFAAAADFQQTQLDLIDEEFGQISLRIDEFPDTPPEQRTPFSLTLLPPGDFNHDGTVDAADYVVWRKNPGGIYTQNDYNTWRANFGQTFFLGSGASSPFPLPPSPLDAAVPEPTSLLLLAIAGLLTIPRRWVVAKNRC